MASTARRRLSKKPVSESYPDFSRSGSHAAQPLPVLSEAKHPLDAGLGGTPYPLKTSPLFSTFVPLSLYLIHDFR